MSITLKTALRVSAAVCAAGFAAALPARAADIPANIGGGLDRVLQDRLLPASARSPMESTAVHDKDGRLMVQVYVDKGASYSAVRAAVVAAGGKIQSEMPSFHHGIIAAWAPAESVAAIARATGVRSVSLVHTPRRNVGLITSQGVAVLKSKTLHSEGYLGAGIVIGALSNSYDTYTAYPASKDVSTGDLPGTGNPLGHTRPVVVLAEGPAGDDEGRGILQILADLDPAAKLCFATAYNSDTDFANDILALADKTGPCHADIIVDDVGYSDEPFFSDQNVISAAVNQVAKQGVMYFSSAGNGNQGSYNATFNPIPPATALALPGQTVNLSQVPAKYLAGGVHNFGTAANPVISQSVVTGKLSGQLADLGLLQWNDPFNMSAVTANYVMLIFDSQGNFLQGDSGVTDAIAADQPEQVAQFPFGVGSTASYQVVLAKSTTAASPATQLRWESFYQALTRQVTFNADHSPSIVGHPGAAGAIAVGADFYAATLGTEYFSSQGPFTNYFDASGNRLATPEVRNKPEISATDGVDTTFFPEGTGNDADGDGFPNFFGTSASAPHAAGVAAQLLQQAGGRRAITPDQMRTILENSAEKHSLSPGLVQATTKSSDGSHAVALLAHGFQPEGYDKEQWQLSVTAPAGVTLSSVTIDATASDNEFSTSFYFGGSNNLTSTQVTTNLTATLAPTMTISFAAGAAVSGTTLDYSVDFDNKLPGYLGINTSLLSGTTVTATFSDGTVTPVQTLSPTAFGHGYTWSDGYGLINAIFASKLVAAAQKK